MTDLTGVLHVQSPYQELTVISRENILTELLDIDFNFFLIYLT
ncbi:hypothetical protein NMYAN_150075 [Nitrosomonas nitrosa]|uniref:Uncharacterized protein n=1 Tax=Nitrosomonas nitrosa TaxID=52442 RepID=A0A8H8Z098_9PROT|nr:hypothetical protein NMYAN_150075 [Nitrosomonas nitrosa]